MKLKKKKDEKVLDKNQKAEKAKTCNLWWFLKKEKKRVGIFLVEALERAYNNLDKFRSKEAESRLSSQRKENSKDFLYRLEKKSLVD